MKLLPEALLFIDVDHYFLEGYIASAWCSKY